MKPINVGLLGIGTVGGGTFTVLKRNAEEITRRAGRPIVITTVADKNLELARKVTGGEVKLTDDAFSVVTDPEIDIVVELIGGYGVAKELVLKAIENGKHVVTANKALLAVHGNEIFAAARYAKEGGLTGLKLYGMVGLPSEEEADVEATAQLLLDLRKATPGLRLAAEWSFESWLIPSETD